MITPIELRKKGYQVLVQHLGQGNRSGDGDRIKNIP